MSKPAKKLSHRQRRLRYAFRKALLVLCGAAIVAGLVAADRFGVFGWAPTPDREKYDGKTFRVVHVVDGDTLDLDVPDGRHSRTRVRLWGVDTPETVRPNVPPQHFGRQASEFTKAQTLGKTVRLELEPYQNTRGDYGRLLAFVRLPDGHMLNRLLIEEGYGYADPRFEHHLKPEFRLPRRAQDSRRGLWADVTNDDLPYYYRDKRKLSAE